MKFSLRRIPVALLAAIIALTGIAAVAPKPAEAAFLDASRTVTTSNSPDVAVPNESGTIPLQADDIVVCAWTYDGATNVFDTGDYPAGFTELGEVDITVDGQSAAVAWKRLTGADTGTYTFLSSVGTSGPYIAMCASFRGRHTTNPPVIADAGANNTGASSPVALDAPSTTAVCGDDILWITVPDVDTNNAANGITQPAGFTVRDTFESGFLNVQLATRENVSAGATGTASGSLALTGGTAGHWSVQVRIPSASATCGCLLCVRRRRG